MGAYCDSAHSHGRRSAARFCDTIIDPADRRHRIHRLPVRRPDDDQRRPQGAGVQCPPGRSGNAAADAPHADAISARCSWPPPTAAALKQRRMRLEDRAFGLCSAGRGGISRQGSHRQMRSTGIETASRGSRVSTREHAPGSADSKPPAAGCWASRRPGPDLASAIDSAYAAVGKIHFDGMHYRTRHRPKRA